MKKVIIGVFGALLALSIANPAFAHHRWHPANSASASNTTVAGSIAAKGEDGSVSASGFGSTSKAKSNGNGDASAGGSGGASSSIEHHSVESSAGGSSNASASSSNCGCQ